jgi:hypothetical protein
VVVRLPDHIPDCGEHRSLLWPALASLGSTAAGDLMGLGRDWRRTDKVVRVEAGVPIVVYIRRDLAVVE